MPGHTHDTSHASANTGNALGDRSSVRQSKLYRMYESGNDVKDILGTSHLQWSTTQKQGVYEGHELYDHTNPYNEAVGSGRRRQFVSQGSPKRLVTHKESAGVRAGNTFSDSYNKSSAQATLAKKQRWKEAMLQERGGHTESILNLSPSRRGKKEEAFDEGDEVEVEYDIQTGRPKLKKTGRKLPNSINESPMGSDVKSLTANERMKLRDQGGRYSSEDVYGPDGELGLMNEIDHLNPDSLERLAKGLSELKHMADEARRRDKLEKLKRELADLDNYTSPYSSPARPQPQLNRSPVQGILKTTSPAVTIGDRDRVEGGEQSLPEDEYTNHHHHHRSTSRPGLHRGSLDTSKLNNTSFSSEAPKVSHSHRTFQEHDIETRTPRVKREETNTRDFYNNTYDGRQFEQPPMSSTEGAITGHYPSSDASKYYNTSYISEMPRQSHSHSTYKRPEGHLHNRQPAHPSTDASQYFDMSYSAPAQSHTHKTYSQTQGGDTDRDTDKRPAALSRRYETNARDFYDNSYDDPGYHVTYHQGRAKCGKGSNMRMQEGILDVRALPVPARARLREDALQSNRISPGQALRQSAPFALDPDAQTTIHKKVAQPWQTQSESQGDDKEPQVLRTARSEALRDTKFW